MRDPRITNSRALRQPVPIYESLAGQLASKVVGQPTVIEALVPCVEMFQAGLAPDNRPVGVFLLLGPTGTGKTRTVEALAETLHGNAKSLLKIDCGEYQMEHEVAKLIGAPPGYLGHRETQPALTQQKLAAVASEKCGLSLVLFDEIEKAAPSMARLMLGLLDRGILRLGDNSQVSFEKAIIFMTSNLGAREMMREIAPDMGFQSAIAPTAGEVSRKLERVAMSAVRRKFSPEFVNRIDQVITYKPLDSASFAAIVDHEVDRLQRHVVARLGARAFAVDVPFAARQWLLENGTSVEYGARELKRTVHRHLTQPLAAMVTRGQIELGQNVRVGVRADRRALTLRTGREGEAWGFERPVVVVADGNRELLRFIERMMSDEGWEVHLAGTLAEAKRAVAKRKAHALIVEAAMPDGRGLDLALQLREANPELRTVLTTGDALTGEQRQAQSRHGVDLLEKPFSMRDAINMIRGSLERPFAPFEGSPKAA